MLEVTIHDLAHGVAPSIRSILAPLLLLGVLVLRLKKYVDHVSDSPVRLDRKLTLLIMAP
jgi:hypothetical protein